MSGSEPTSGALRLRLKPDVTSDAVSSPDGIYRYRLARTWDYAVKHLVWVMCHPSLTDPDQDDVTTRRCELLTRSWGWGGITVVNLFALRCRSWHDLLAHPGPVGAHNDDHILFAARDWHARATIAAWGNQGVRFGRGDRIEVLLRAAVPGRLWRLGGPLTVKGQPPNPLFYPNGTVPVPWT